MNVSARGRDRTAPDLVTLLVPLFAALLPGAEIALAQPSDWRAVDARRFDFEAAIVPIGMSDLWGTTFRTDIRLPLAGPWRFAAELAVADVEANSTRPTFGSPPSGPQVTFANPYLGLEYRPATTGPWCEVGLRLPLAGASQRAEPSRRVGASSDLSRAEAFAEKTSSVRLGLHHRHGGGGRPSLDLGVAPVVWFGEALRRDFEVHLGYHAHGWLDVRALRFHAGVNGRWQVTAHSGASVRPAHEVEAGAQVGAALLRPGAVLRAPLGERSRFTPWTLGFSLAIVPG